MCILCLSGIKQSRELQAVHSRFVRIWYASRPWAKSGTQGVDRRVAWQRVCRSQHHACVGFGGVQELGLASHPSLAALSLQLCFHILQFLEFPCLSMTCVIWAKATTWGTHAADVDANGNC